MLQPALGWIFRDYLSGYTHWAFADLDVLMGDLRRFVGPRELQHYDAITLSFGDQFRAYTRQDTHRQTARRQAVARRVVDAAGLPVCLWWCYAAAAASSGGS